MMTKCINGLLRIDDMVLCAGDDMFEYLVGYVRDIEPVGAYGHDPDHDEDDVMVDFTEPEYSLSRREEILQKMRSRFRHAVGFEDLPLDGVILPPSCLIRINGIAPGPLERILDNQATARRLSNGVIRLQGLSGYKALPPAA